MIKEVSLSHWKSFERSTLNIDPLTLVIGTNASGKSNLLDALVFLQRVASGVGIFQAINGDVNLTPIRGGLEWVCRKPAKEFSLEVLLGGDNSAQDLRYKLSIKVNGVKAEVSSEELSLLSYGPRSAGPKVTLLYNTRTPDEQTPGIPAHFTTGTKGAAKRFDVNRSQIVLVQADACNPRPETRDAIKLVIASLKDIFVFDPIPSHMRNYTPFSETLQADGSNIAGVLAALDETSKQAIEATLTKYLKDLPEREIQRIWTEPIGKFKTDAMLYCEEGWTGAESHVVDARGMSDGTLRYLAIVTALLTRPKNSLLVIEEVDNGLHPSRAHLLVKMLQTLGQERGIDVLITTHNPALLDAVGLRLIPFITVANRDQQSGASLLTHLEDLEQLPKLMASGSLGRLSTDGRLEAAMKAEPSK